MELEIILSELSDKDKYQIISLIYGIFKKSDTYLQTRNRLTDKFMVTKGEREEGIN